MQEVLETARKVTEMSQQIKIDKQALARLCNRFCEDRITVPAWERRYHFDGRGRDRVFYLLVLDSLNFCFWPAPGKAKWEIEYKSERLSGYYALAVSLKKALEEGVPIIRADYLAHITLDGLQRIFGGRGELQLMEARAHILSELGEFLIKEYGGEAHSLVEVAGNSALSLVRLLVENLPSFRDGAEYLGEEIYFYKRAQIVAADLYGSFGGKEWGCFTDVDELTAFADYKLPQVLRHVGILRYAKALAQKVDQRMLLTPGSPDEVEIRANTIWAVELMRQELRRLGKNLRAFEVDWILWNLSQNEDFKAKPYHRTVTIYY